VAEVVVEHERPDSQGGGRLRGHPGGRKRRDASINEVIGNGERREPDILGLPGSAHPLVMPRLCKHVQTEPKILHAHPCSHDQSMVGTTERAEAPIGNDGALLKSAAPIKTSFS
jgi:hypothetical protein